MDLTEITSATFDSYQKHNLQILQPIHVITGSEV